MTTVRDNTVAGDCAGRDVNKTYNAAREPTARLQERQTVVGKFVLSDLLAMPTNGDNGLKHRSSLIEHRYDIA